MIILKLFLNERDAPAKNVEEFEDKIVLFKDSMSVYFRSEIFTSYILTTFQQ